MIDTVEAIALGVVQGVTEYLPVSSSGHLVIAQRMFGITKPEIFFDIVLHLGTLSAVLIYYRNDLITAWNDSVKGLTGIRSGIPFKEVVVTYPGFRLVWLIIIGSVPTAMIGLTFRNELELAFGSVSFVGVMLIFTAILLFLTRFTEEAGKTVEKISIGDALAIGFVQGLAILPGVSRSGATICTALFLGIKRETAARYSFLLSIPSITGAFLVKYDGGSGGIPYTTLGTGFIISAVTGYICLALLVAVVKKGGLHWFSIYCLLAGVTSYIFLADN